MQIFKVISSLLLCSVCACSEGGNYNTVNPPMDGVVIGGNGDGVSGFVRVEADSGSPSCPEGSGCFLSVSNRSFVTLRVPLSRAFLSDPNADLGIYVSYGNQNLTYVYRKNGDFLERNNARYERGVYPKSSSYNLQSLLNESEQEILVRGVFPLRKTGWHLENVLFAYLKLKSHVQDGDTLRVSVSPLDVTKNPPLRLPADSFAVSFPKN